MKPLSARNARVQQLRRLVRKPSARQEAGLFVVEGAGLVADAVDAGRTPVDVFMADAGALDSDLVDRLVGVGSGLWLLEPHVVAATASTTSPQPVIATFEIMDASLGSVTAGRPSFVLVASALSDPGNAGTVVRTGAAAGADAVIFCDESADVLNPKAVRAAAGALWRTDVVRSASSPEVLGALEAVGMTSVGLSGRAETHYADVDYADPVAVVLGNEAHGLSPELAEGVDRLVSIPMERGVESLNVATAAAVVGFEIARQRRGQFRRGSSA